jgi:hypothetical protein
VDFVLGERDVPLPPRGGRVLLADAEEPGDRARGASRGGAD